MDNIYDDNYSEWNKFIKKNNKIKPYAHFDKRISLRIKSIRNYVVDRENITKHGFYPLIHFEKNFSKYTRKSIKKKFRELYYCSHLDRCVYQRYAFLLNQQYNIWTEENELTDVVIAYRDNLGKNNIDFAKKAFDKIQSFSECFIFVGDFDDFFDNLNHVYLKRMLCKLLKTSKLPEDYYAIFKNITRYSSIEWEKIVEICGKSINTPGIRKQINEKERVITKKQFRDNKSSIKKNVSKKGIPQGAPISSVLSNIYMMEFDNLLNHYVQEKNGMYMRYADDFIIILPIKKTSDIQDCQNYVFSACKGNIELTLQKEKTKVYFYKDKKIFDSENTLRSLNYLGFIFDGMGIKIRPKSITKYYYRMHRKAKNISKNGGYSSKGRHIFAYNLYKNYSLNPGKQTFISYAKQANRKLNLNDPESLALIKKYKQKIRQAIKKGKQY